MMVTHKIHHPMKHGIAPLLAVLVGTLLLGGCGDDFQRVRIGSHDFTEQKILAEMMALLAEDAGVRVERAIPYGDNRKSLQAIQRGILDAYPEYDGSLLSLSGVPRIRDPRLSTVAVRELVEPLGLAWLEPFGLNDGFALAVRRDMAIRRDMGRISDLTDMRGALTFAADKGYLARPVDGLYALARRYGLNVGKVELFPVGDRNQIYNALADQHVDVAEVFMTDARLDDYGILELEDDLGFYPVYRPAPLVRQDTLARFPKLADAWNRLAGRIGTDDMRRLNGRVERQGKDYRDVARRHLEALDLLPEEPVASEPRGTVTLAVTPLSDLGYLPIRAAEAIREVMPARRLQVAQNNAPAEAVRDGSARFGLLGAEEFFDIGPRGELKQVRDIEAVGAVGSRLAHVIARADDTDPRDWQRVGTGVEGSGNWKAAWMLLDALGMLDQVKLVPIGDPTRADDELAAGEVDALVAMIEQGHAGLVKLLEASDFVLADLADVGGANLALRYPFLRPARIPANTYPRQDQPLNTVSSQVVLATRMPPQQDLLGESGPGFVPGVFTRLPQRLPYDTALRLAEALDTPENVDPLLPASPGLTPDTPPTKQRFTADVVSALLNGLAVVFLVAMIVLFMRPLPKEPALRAGSEPPEST
jgi:glycine betaine/choline ABC-type transport system substrate-binding protein